MLMAKKFSLGTLDLNFFHHIADWAKKLHFQQKTEARIEALNFPVALEKI